MKLDECEKALEEITERSERWFDVARYVAEKLNCKINQVPRRIDQVVWLIDCAKGIRQEGGQDPLADLELLLEIAEFGIPGKK